ncbi:zonadhesin-like [Tubulanus polymorphus]|uniref:zonadhesin-like n=1 Tax=Tubulanus polymorphus TaxID=672921 RepID=UPI003DA2928B
MCGNCDGNKRNDFRTKDGLNVWGLRNAVSLVGNSFVVADDRGNLPPICKVPPPTLPPCDPSKKQLFSSRDYCGIITDQSGPFGQCISDPDVDANQFFDSCVVDLCQVTNDSMWQDQLCEDIAAFVDKCTSENIAPGNWRNETKCIPDCGADELYSVMMTGCPETCDSPFPTACDEPKQEGCACREGYVRLNDACVPRQSAGCVFDGYTMCECKAYGDPHFITYDIARLDFMGIGRFVFSRASLDDRPECSFIAEVITAHYNSTRSTASNPLSYAKEIDITIGANKIEFLKNQVVKVNGVVQTLPTQIGAIELNTTIPSGVNETGDVFLHVEGCEIKVFYDGKTKVEILVDKNLYRGQLTGICGNCDGDKSNDYVTAAGIDVVTKIDRDKLVGESWRL